MSNPSLVSNDSKSAAASYHHGDLKTSLIEAANTILQREGADALSLRAIASEVGVSHTAPYSHFKNKKQLIRAVSDLGFSRLAAAMREGAEQAEASESLVLTYGASYLQFALANPELYRLMLGQVEARGLKKVSAESLFSNGNLSQKEPFGLLQEAFASFLKDPNEVKNKALGAWALVHGMAALLIEGYITVPDNMTLKQFLLAVTPAA